MTQAFAPRYSWIDTPGSFERMLESLTQVRRFAVDIEADSLYHYYEKVCLIQISTDKETFIVDPLTLQDLQALAPITADSSVEKVFHAAGYDVTCLRRDHDLVFAKVFDTHLAARLLGYEQLGLSSLLEKMLGVAHSKQRQRDDWSRRPLRPDQLDYAAGDTQHLLKLRDMLEEQLRQTGRLEWALEEFEAVTRAEREERAFDSEGFRRIKGSQSLSPNQLAVLRALYLLRDRYARQMDLPPFKVLNNSVLVDLSRRPPVSLQTLLKRPGISARLARRFAHEIYRTIERAREEPSQLALRSTVEYTPPSREARARLERLKAWRQSKSKELGLHVGVVFPGEQLESLAARPPADLDSLKEREGMRRWRVRQFGEEILQILV